MPATGWLFPDVPYSYYPRGDVDWSIGGTPGLKDWENFKDLVKKYMLNPQDYPEVINRARISGELAYSPAFRELADQAQRAQQQYEYARQNLEPAYRTALSDIGLMRQRQAQETGQAMQAAQESAQAAEQRALADLTRRGLFRSGLGEYTAAPIRQRAMQEIGNIQTQGLLGQERLGLRGAETAQEQANRLNQLLDTYRQTVNNIEQSRRKLSEEQGKRAYLDYQNFLQDMMKQALGARQQQMAERTAWDTMYWNQAKFLEDMRRYGLDYALKLAQLRAAEGAGSAAGRYFPTSPTGEIPGGTVAGVPQSLANDFEALVASTLFM